MPGFLEGLFAGSKQEREVRELQQKILQNPKNYHLFVKLGDLLEKKGRRAAIVVANEFSPLALANFLSFDAYINTACPRISDDREAYGKPVVNVADIKRLLELMV